MVKVLLTAVISLVWLCSGSVPAILAQEKPATSAAKPAGQASATKVIARVWHGSTLKTKADEYEKYLYEAGIKKILAIPGNLGVQSFRRDEGQTTEFTVISFWGSIDAIKRFAGEDYEKTHHLPKDPEYLLKLEPFVVHHEVWFQQPAPAVGTTRQ
ncbi:MAG: antibiotic biosynthesis monooxygenase [Blastocatellia bacterium]|nr:antibiotic biosynthesis monooxygenase [Blastocatellia bacterium]